MKKMIFVLVLLMQVNCAAEHIILNFWQDKSLKTKQHFYMPLSFENYSTIFKAMLDEADDDLVKVDGYIEKLPFTIEIMTNLVFLTNSLYGQELRKSTDIDMVLDEDISKTLYLLEAARFFNLHILVDLLNDIVNQKAIEHIFLEKGQQSKFYNDLSTYFSSYGSLSKIWFLSGRWEKIWCISENKKLKKQMKQEINKLKKHELEGQFESKKQEIIEKFEKKKKIFYLGFRPRLYSIFTLLLRETIKQPKESNSDSFFLL